MMFENINYCWGSLMVEELARCGIDYCCIAPGSRSAPLAVAAARNPKLKTCVHIDERGLAFHALGYVTATRKPAVLISTSGTAAANFFPAIVEAAKKKLPLIVMTADRPPELRQTGAVQTIDQVGLFGKYALWQTDMPCPDFNIKPEMVLTTIDQAVYQAKVKGGVVHINCMFREPLAPVKVSADWKAYTQRLKIWWKTTAPYTAYVAPVRSMDLPDAKMLAARINGIKNGLIVVGKTNNEKECRAVIALAKHLGWPIFADIASGLRLGYKDAAIIHYYDQVLLSEVLRKDLIIDGVLHVGGRITSKRYYEFIEEKNPGEYVMVLNHALRNDPLHRVTLRVETGLTDFCKKLRPLLKPRVQSTQLEKLIKINKKIDQGIDVFFKNDARICEPWVARLISRLIRKGSGLFLANSMPIRDMDMYADFKGRPVVVAGNRGASGIDGLVASAAGFSVGLTKPVTLMIGDISFLHDLNSLALLRDTPVPLIMVVLNNGGGGIFSFLPIAQAGDVFEKYFGTPHALTFANAAAMFELNYAQPRDTKQLADAYRAALKSGTSTIIEVITSRDENLKAHQALQGFLNGL